MPIYEYVCESCGKLNEVLQKVADPAPEQCDACNAKGPLQKVVSRSSFVLKGGGWYSDLYGSTKKGGASDAKPSSGAAKDVASKTESTSSSSGSSTSSSAGEAKKSEK